MNGRAHETQRDVLHPHRPAARRGRALVACAIVLLASRAIGPTTSTAASPRDAVLVSLTERDLNRVALGLFRSLGGPVLEGTKATLSRGIHDLRYRAELSEPRVELDEQGGASLALRIREADVRFGRLERRVGRRDVACENAGLVVEPDRPVDLRVALRLQVRDGEIEILPERAWVTEPKERFRLVKPSSCRNTLLPTWLLWWIGKGELQRRLEKLDEVVLSTARKMAAEINGRRDLLAWRWSRRDRGDGNKGLFLHPRSIETHDGSLVLALATPGGPAGGVGEASPPWARQLSGQSFVALSESFLDEVVDAALRGSSHSPRRPTGDLRKLFRSSSIYALIPGLRAVGPADDLYLAVHFGAAPQVELEDVTGSGKGSRPVIHVRLRDIEVGLFKAAPQLPGERIGVLRVESATLSLAPYVNLLGGFSFDLFENRWTVRSEGIEADDRALDATLQEAIFGEVFETRFEPVAREAFRVGSTEFRPRSLRVVDDYLVIGFDES